MTLPTAADTIFALASAPGRAGVAVVRVSGPAAGPVLDRMTKSRPAPRSVCYRRLRHPTTGEILDRGIVLWSPAPLSFTGEDVAELHVHGGPAVVKSVLAALAGLSGLRMAEPGEFTRRAFDHGKIDLSEAEGLADLIDAETESQRRQALDQASGSLSSVYEGWRGRLIEASALVEAAIDFSDEADVAADALNRARNVVYGLHNDLAVYLADGHRGEILRDGFRVTLAGPPNVGKSSLLNALARRDAAIVSEEAGTTRDVIEIRLDLNGYPVLISDTAGIRKTVVKLEREGIRRTVAAARASDLVLWLMDSQSLETEYPSDLSDTTDRTLVVVSKADLLTRAQIEGLPAGLIAVSAKSNDGMEQLTRMIATLAGARIGSPSTVVTSERQRGLLARAAASLEAFLAGSLSQPELRAEDLRLAGSALGRLTGRVDVEDVLDQVFKRFCIGK
jgi:tRNA modification GTPase